MNALLAVDIGGIDGRIYYEQTGNAGHIGHIVIDLHGDPCPCGGRGRVETFGSGSAMTRWALAHGRSSTEPDVRGPALDYVRRVRVHPRSLGADAGLPGAAALVLDAGRP
jgi:glucokinase